MSVSGDIKQNYTDLHTTTGESYASIARRVATHGDHHLAAWLREQATAAGEDTTPYEADFAGGDAVRGADDETAPDADAKANAEDLAPSGAAPEPEDEYAVLTDDEIRKLAKERKVDAGGSRDEVITRLKTPTK